MPQNTNMPKTCIVVNVIFKSHKTLNVGNVGNVTKSFQIMPQEMLVMLKNLGKL